MSEQQQANEAEKNIEMWKVKKLIKRLTQARGNGTSMISLIIRTSASTRSCKRHPPSTLNS
jgi:peptide subunit release factor 1 (eRF1)